MKSLANGEYTRQAIEIISKGAFLTTAANGKVNTMTIGWGQIGVIWYRDIFNVLVRPSRFTYQLIEKNGEFTVSLPIDQQKFAEALRICGTESGKDQNKIAKSGLNLLAGTKVSVPVIGGCGLHYECRVLYKQPMNNPIDDDIRKTYYPDNDYHTMFFAEIVASYLEKS